MRAALAACQAELAEERAKRRRMEQALRELQKMTDGVIDIGWDGVNKTRVIIAEALCSHEVDE